jgi:hypothetical protein
MLVAVLLTLALAASATAAPPLQLRLAGACVTQLYKNALGVVGRSTVTCTTTGHCACDGPSAVAYQTITVSAGNGANGLQHGTITVRGAHGAVSLKLRGSGAALGASRGSWRLGGADGALATGALAHSGAYSSTWTVNDPILGTMTAKVHVALSVSCWACGRST